MSLQPLFSEIFDHKIGWGMMVSTELCMENNCPYIFIPGVKQNSTWNSSPHHSKPHNYVPLTPLQAQSPQLQQRTSKEQYFRGRLSNWAPPWSFCWGLILKITSVIFLFWRLLWQQVSRSSPSKRKTLSHSCQPFWKLEAQAPQA